MCKRKQVENRLLKTTGFEIVLEQNLVNTAFALGSSDLKT